MKIKILVSIIFTWTIISCNNYRKQETPKPETPKALQEKSSSVELLSKRSFDDLVESLYTELISKDVDLKKLEDNIDDLKRSKNDSINLFDKFNEKNESYYNSANRHCEEIKDSTLRNKIRILVVKNLTNYNSSIAKHNELLKIIETKELTISDLHNILKIVKTLPVIDKYQKDNLPRTKTLEGYIKRQEETIKDADKLNN